MCHGSRRRDVLPLQSAAKFGDLEAVSTAKLERSGRHTAMESTDLIDVLVVDGHDMVAKGLALIVSRDQTMRVVGTAGTIKQAAEWCSKSPPDVVLMDIGLPDGDAAAAVSRIRALSPACKVVMVTGATDDRALAIAVDTGCAGYVHKTASIEELLGAVSSAAAGKTHFSAVALARLLHERRSPPLGIHTISDREREVLQRLADGSSVAEIAGRLGLSTHTVRNHIRRAMRHLGAHTRLDAVVAAARAGILSFEHSGPRRTNY
jgi:DNA-binding NarL/FixJ family response regulator